MRTLFQTIKQQFLEETILYLFPLQHPQGLHQEVPVPACWSENGRISGTIGGGAVEYRAECMALDILEKRNPASMNSG